jgi:FixJ family two-component response regulator
MNLPRPPFRGQVYLVDDEPGMLKALTRLLHAEGFTVQAFLSAREFLADYRPGEIACLVLDVAMPECDGPALQRHLAAEGDLLPIIFLTGHGDIPMAVQAIKSGAVDFLTKPVADTVLLAAVGAALQIAKNRALARVVVADIRARFATLTIREREVLSHVITGRLNKQVAAELGVSLQTIKIHRMHMMEKMGCTSVAELVRVSALADLQPTPIT